MKKLITALAIIAMTASTAYACRMWTTTVVKDGRMVICSCTDCGAGPTCFCN